MMRRFARNHADVTRWLLHSRFFAVASTLSVNDTITPTRSAISRVSPLCPTPSRSPSFTKERTDVKTVRYWSRAMQFRGFHATVAEQRDPEEVMEAIIRQLKSTDDYARVMRRLSRDQSYSRVVDLYEDMKSCGVEINASAYTALMKAHSRMGNPDKVKSIFEEAVEKGVTPDKWMINTLIYTYSNTGDMEAAFDILHKMPEYGVQPDSVTYRSLINVCGKGKDVDRARKTFDEMLEKFKWDTRTINSMIEVYAENADSDTGEAYLQESKNLVKMLKSKRLKIDAFTYVHMIKLCSKLGKSDEAMDYFQLALGDDLQLSISSFDIIFQCMADMKLTDEEVENLLVLCIQRMKKLDIRPSYLTFNNIMKLCEARGDVSKAFGLFTKLTEGELADTGRSAECFSVQVKIIERMLDSGAYSREEALIKMDTVLERMKMFGISLMLAGYRARFNICLKTSDVERAFECWNDYAKGNRVPSATMTESMIRLTLDHDRVDDAVKLVKFMQKDKNIPPTEGTYEAIFAYCAEKNDAENAKTVLKFMKEKQVKASKVIQGHVDALELN